jgi:hypothetical protein
MTGDGIHASVRVGDDSTNATCVANEVDEGSRSEGRLKASVGSGGSGNVGVETDCTAADRGLGTYTRSTVRKSVMCLGADESQLIVDGSEGGKFGEVASSQCDVLCVVHGRTSSRTVDNNSCPKLDFDGTEAGERGAALPRTADATTVK